MAQARKYFGTDGIRGKAGVELTADIALRLGQAAGLVFRNGHDVHRVIVGKDTRRSSYMFENSIIGGLTSAGMEVLETGPLPTPAIAMLTSSMRCEFGVMITASHNPYSDNGIKLFDAQGNKLPDEKELKIEALMDSDMSKLLASKLMGRARRIDGAQDRYIEHAKRTLNQNKKLGINFEGMRIVVDCAHGAGYLVAPEALWELGAEVVQIGTSPDGININHECGSTAPDALIRMVKERRADFGIALDGDADRVLLVDEKGEIVDGDQILALIATQWHKDGRLAKPGVVGTILSNLGLERHLAEHGLALERSAVGDRYVLERMNELGYNVGGEQSGHFILSDYNTTGDGLVTALQVLSVIQREDKPASQVCHLFEPVPQTQLNVRVRDKKVLGLPAVQAVIQQMEQKLSTTGRLVVRPSGTEPKIRIMVEGDNPDTNEQIAGEIKLAVETAEQ